MKEQFDCDCHLCEYIMYITMYMYVYIKYVYIKIIGFHRNPCSVYLIIIYIFFSFDRIGCCTPICYSIDLSCINCWNRNEIKQILQNSLLVSYNVCVCVCVCVCVWREACVRECVRACACVHACVRITRTSRVRAVSVHACDGVLTSRSSSK